MAKQAKMSGIANLKCSKMKSKRKNTEVSGGAGTTTTTNASTVTRSTAQYIAIISPP